MLKVYAEGRPVFITKSWLEMEPNKESVYHVEATRYQIIWDKTVSHVNQTKLFKQGLMVLASKSYIVDVMLYLLKPNLDHAKDAVLVCVLNQVSEDVLYHIVHLTKSF